MVTKKIVISQDGYLLSLLEDSFFQREHFTLVPVADQQTGVEAVEIEAPALAIFSVPVMQNQALACCRQIKTDQVLGKTAVLLLLPDDADDDLAEACWSAGCDALLHPPLTVGRLLDTACGLLGIDQRIARRWPVCMALEFTADDEQTYPATALNLTEGGMFLASEKLFPVDTRLLLDLTLPGSETPFVALVRVAWVNHPEWQRKEILPCGMGVEFIRLNQLAKSSLKEFLNALKVPK
ncbi:MAG: PilZ domain-containing protein [Deltaproteobacteria bacterium]|jgi:uncharacterized protein (TIGR02266 family)|nr:PilZ domain-containing protein [Deltaproteobacteria bacterium]